MSKDGPIEQYQAIWLEAASADIGLVVFCSDPGRLRMCLHRAKASLASQEDLEMQAFPEGTFGLPQPALVIARGLGLKGRRGRPPKHTTPSHPDDDILGDLGI